MIALCPNCHAIKTYGRTRHELTPATGDRSPGALWALRQHGMTVGCGLQPAQGSGGQTSVRLVKVG